EMEVKMEHALPPIGSVGREQVDRPAARGARQAGQQTPRGRESPGRQPLRHVEQILVVWLRYHQNVARIQRLDIEEGDHLRVLIDDADRFLAADDLAEDAVRILSFCHGRPPRLSMYTPVVAGGCKTYAAALPCGTDSARLSPLFRRRTAL